MNLTTLDPIIANAAASPLTSQRTVLCAQSTSAAVYLIDDDNNNDDDGDRDDWWINIDVIWLFVIYFIVCHHNYKGTSLVGV
jgi:hypothetical protein